MKHLLAPLKNCAGLLSIVVDCRSEVEAAVVLAVDVGKEVVPAEDPGLEAVVS